MIRKSLFAIPLIVLGLSGVTQAAQPQKAFALPVKVFKIEDKKSIISKDYPSLLKAYEEVKIIARVKGVLEEKHFQEGSFVKKGTLLYKLEQDTYLANLNMAKANLKKAQANYNKASKDYQRAQALLKTKAISMQSYDDYTYAYEDAQAQIQSAKAALTEAQIQFNYTQIKAPIDGITSMKNFDIGTLVGSNESNSTLLTITNTNPIYAEFSLSKDDVNKYLSQIKSKTVKVNLLVNGKKIENGEIDYISPKIDSNTDSLNLRAKFNNKNNELIIGEFVKVQLDNLDLGNVRIIPEDAILKTAKGTFVYVVQDSTAKIRPVQTGMLTKDGIVIKGGLNANEQIIISNIIKVRPDSKVQAITKEK